jgi:hypothetical protein
MEGGEVMMVALDVGPPVGTALILGSVDTEGSTLMLGSPDGALLILGSVEGFELVLGSLLTVGAGVGTELRLG